jgi:hypothetical protein
MNANKKLSPELPIFRDEEHKLDDGDTFICACEKCGKRMLDFGANIHEHEYHSGEILGDFDDAVVERINLEAAL